MSGPASLQLSPAANDLLRRHQQRIYVQTDYMFAWLMGVQWAAGVLTSMWVSPLSWSGPVAQMHPHVWSAVFLGAVISAGPILLAWFAPGAVITRHVIACGQSMMSSLLIHLSGGRIETHFHVFGSLAFLAFYRDWRVLLSATSIIAGDHFFRGVMWPQSVYGVLDAATWRAGEHAAWVLFEDVFLIFSCVRSQHEMREIAVHQANLLTLNQQIEQQVAERTADLTQRTQELAESESRYREVSNAVPMMVWTADDAGRCTSVNQRWLEFTGRPLHEELGEGWHEVVHPADQEPTRTAMLAAIAWKLPFDVEFRARRADGVYRWLFSRGVPRFNEANEFLGYIGGCFDVTARKRHEADMQESHRALDDALAASVKHALESRAARDAAEAADHAKSEFLANMSHEIRTPMTAILGYADVLIEEGDLLRAPLKRMEAVRTIKRNGEHLLSIINDILDLSKIEAGKMVTASEACSPTAIARDIESLMAVRAADKGLRLQVEFAGPLPETIRTDPTRLRQILVNLVGNALKFTTRGEVKVVVRCVEEPKPRMEFDVLDSGIGISAEEQTRLFQPFTQADTSTTRRFGGTGLGLTISKRLAERLGGDVCIVESIVGQGTRFRITIDPGPLEGVPRLQPTSTGEPLSPPAPIAEKVLQGARILLAEDGVDNQRLIAFVLRKAGAEVVIVENGRLAVDAALDADISGRPFDVVLSDMSMPVMDGYEAATMLRSQNYTRPIIALTAHAMAGDREKCLLSGCSDFATKPINREALIETVRKHFEAAAVSA